ncbi:LOW QUALITY PROTEIN: hypothetical protein HID58_002897, partial [Brassica napus]
ASGAMKDLEGTDYPVRHPEFRYKTEFQSHEPEIEEKQNLIRLSQTANGALFLFSTNDKNIKFWKVLFYDCLFRYCFSFTFYAEYLNTMLLYSYISKDNDYSFPTGDIPSMQLPAVELTLDYFLPVTRCRRVYTHAHDYHIYSISNNSDGETFISADDLRINLWNLERSNQSFNIVDVKPANMEDIIASVLDVKFAKGGRDILSCDYMMLKVHTFTNLIGAFDDICYLGIGYLWDINMDSGPLSTFQFECCLSEEWLQVLTGMFEIHINFFEFILLFSNNTPAISSECLVFPRESPEGDANGNSFDHTTKLLHLAWHPTENSIACLRPTVCTCTMLEEKRKHPQIEKEALATCETE